MKEGLSSLIFLVFLSVSVFSQEPAYWQLSEADGLPSLTVYKILQDSSGYMWFATAGGLCRFDGKLIKQYKSSDLVDNEVIFIQEDKWGRVWGRNLNGQMIMAKDDSLQIISLPPPFDKIKRATFFIDGVYLWIQEAVVNAPISVTFACFELDNEGPPKLIYRHEVDQPLRFANFSSEAGRKHYFWVLKEKFVHLLEISANQISTKAKFLPPSNIVLNHSFRIYPVEESTVLIHDNYSLLLFDIQRAETLDYSLGAARIQDISVDTKKDIYISTTKGIQVFNKNQIRALNNEHFFQRIGVNYSFRDRENNLWLGTSGDGVIIIPDLTVDVFNTSNSNLAENEIHCIESTGAKKLFSLGHNKGSLTVLDNGQVSHKYKLENDARVVAIAHSNPDVTWLGSDNGITVPSYRINDKKGGFKKWAVKDILSDGDRSIWVASSDKVASVRFDINYGYSKSIEILDVQTIFSQRTYALHKDYEDNLWIGSVSGLFKYTNNQLDTFKEGAVFREYRVSDIAQTADSSLWVATYGDGLLQIKNDTVVNNWNENTGFPTSICTALYVNKNDLWVGTNRGMTRLTNGVYNNHWIDSYDGLPSNEVRAIYVNQEGVWVGTPQGLAKFPLTALKKNEVPPAIFITGVQVNDQDTVSKDNYRLNFKESNLSISFLGFAYRARGNVKYRYRLLGLTDQWTETQDRKVTFFTLAPGDYQFEVQAINEGGVRSIKPATITFTISKPWWRQLWFQIGSILALLSLSSGIVYWRQRDLRNREKRELGFRDRINNLRLEALQTQMNPHFIFNALNAIQGFLITNDREQAIHYLSSFARMIRQVFEYSRRKSISLEEEIDFLNLYLELEKLRFGDRVEVIFEIEPSLKENITEHFLPPLLIQPIIENAFKHGLMHKKGNSTLRILFEMVDRHLKCTVEDDGIGREKVKKFNQWREKPRKTSGLKATEERLDIFQQNKENKIGKYLLITDLYDQEGSPTGTKVEIYI